MKQTISKSLEPGESHLPWLSQVKANVRLSDSVTIGPAICIRNRDGTGKVEVELTSDDDVSLILARMVLHRG